MTKLCLECGVEREVLTQDEGTALASGRTIYFLAGCNHTTTDVTEDMVEPLVAETRRRVWEFIGDDEIYWSEAR